MIKIFILLLLANEYISFVRINNLKQNKRKYFYKDYFFHKNEKIVLDTSNIMIGKNSKFFK